MGNITGKYQRKKKFNDLLKKFGFKSFICESGDEFITDQASCITTVKLTDGEIKESLPWSSLVG